MNKVSACGVGKADFFTRVYKRSSKIVARKVEDEFILVPIEEGVGDTDSIYTLNEVGTAIWERLDGKKSLKEIAKNLLKEYKVSKERLNKDIEGFIKALEKIGAVKSKKRRTR